MYDNLDALGICGMSKIHVCVDETRLPLGRRILRGLLDGSFVLYEAPDIKKWLDAPESKMAHFVQLFLINVVFGIMEASAKPIREWLLGDPFEPRELNVGIK